MKTWNELETIYLAIDKSGESAIADLYATLRESCRTLDADSVVNYAYVKFGYIAPDGEKLQKTKSRALTRDLSKIKAWLKSKECTVAEYGTVKGLRNDAEKANKSKGKAQGQGTKAAQGQGQSAPDGMILVPLTEWNMLKEFYCLHYPEYAQSKATDAEMAQDLADETIDVTASEVVHFKLLPAPEPVKHAKVRKPRKSRRKAA